MRTYSSPTFVVEGFRHSINPSTISHILKLIFREEQVTEAVSAQRCKKLGYFYQFVVRYYLIENIIWSALKGHYGYPYNLLDVTAVVFSQNLVWEQWSCTTPGLSLETPFWIIQLTMISSSEIPPKTLYIYIYIDILVENDINILKNFVDGLGPGKKLPSKKQMLLFSWGRQLQASQNIFTCFCLVIMLNDPLLPCGRDVVPSWSWSTLGLPTCPLSLVHYVHSLNVFIV